MSAPLKILTFFLLACATLSAQCSISVTSPTPGATVAGYSGNVASISQSGCNNRIASIQYTLDGEPLRNPGPVGVVSGSSGALANEGVAVTPPFAFAWNPNWYGNGSQHEMIAYAYDASCTPTQAAIGSCSAIATSSPVDFSIANPWPTSCSGTPSSLSVTWPASPWTTPTVSITGTMSGCPSTDHYAWFVYLHGSLVASMGSISCVTSYTGASQTFTVDTTRAHNGTYPVVMMVYDCTNGSAANPLAGQWGRQIAISNSSTQVVDTQCNFKQTVLNLTTGATKTLTCNAIHADGSIGSSSFWAATGTFLPVVTVSGTAGQPMSSATITPTAEGSTPIYTMTARYTGSDGATAGTPTLYALKPTSYTVTGAENGRDVVAITGGTNCIPGLYGVTSATPSTNTLDVSALNQTSGAQNFPSNTTNFATAAATCTWAIGPADIVWALSYPGGAQPVAHITNSGGISRTYVPGSSVPVISPMLGFQGFNTQQYPPIASNGIGNYLNSFCSGSFNAIEVSPSAVPSGNWTGSSYNTQAAFTSTISSYISSQVAMISPCSKMRFSAYMDSIFKTDSGLWQITQGVGSLYSVGGTAFPTLSQLQILSNILASSGKFMVAALADEVQAALGIDPLVGPVRFYSGSSSPQSWLASISSDGAGHCTATTNLAGFSNTFYTSYLDRSADQWLWSSGNFIITGSATPNMNSAANTHYSATAMNTTQFTFACAGVAMGTYNASNDPGLTIQTFSGAVGSYWSSTSGPSGSLPYLNYDGAANFRTQWTSQAGAIPIFPSSMGDYSNKMANVACWFGGPACQQSITTGGSTVNTISDICDIYYDHSAGEAYTQQQMAYNSIAGENWSQNGGYEEGWLLRSLLGSGCDPSRPMSTILTLTYDNYIPQPTQSLNVVSCSGNTLTVQTSSTWPLPANFIPGLARLTVAGNSDPNCNGNFVILSMNPMTGSIGLARAATSQIFSDDGAGTVTSATWSSGTATFTLGAGTNITLNLKAGNTITLTGMNPSAWNGTYVLATGAQFCGPCTVTASVASNPGTFVSGGPWTSAGYDNGGTAHWPDGTTTVLTEVSADGATNAVLAGGTQLDYGNIPITTYSNNGICGGNWSSTVEKHRGQNVTFTGVTGPGASYFNGTTFNFSIENIEPPTDNLGIAQACPYMREIPNANGTGGTVSIIVDNGLVAGRNVNGFLPTGACNVNTCPSMPGSITDPAGVMMQLAEGIISSNIAMARVYQYSPPPNAYQPTYVAGVGGAPAIEPGFTGTPASYSLTTPYTAYPHPQAEQGYSVPDHHAISNEGLLWQYAAPWYLGATPQDCPDLGRDVEACMWQSSMGRMIWILNATNGAVTRTVNLSACEYAGQNVAVIPMIWHNMMPFTTIAAGTSSYSLTLAEGMNTVILCPQNYAAAFTEPTVSFDLADGGPSATGAYVNCGYDGYTQPLAPAFPLTASNGSVGGQLPWDKTIGPGLECTVSYVNSAGARVAGGPSGSPMAP